MSYFGCWDWKAGHTQAGYGTVRIDKQLHYVHRLVYEETVGPIPSGHLIHHTCCNRGCYNPAHLQLATNATHPDGGPAKLRARTHCANGHEFSEANTYITTRGSRKCRACNREWMRHKYWEQRNGQQILR